MIILKSDGNNASNTSRNEYFNKKITIYIWVIKNTVVVK